MLSHLSSNPRFLSPENWKTQTIKTENDRITTKEQAQMIMTLLKGQIVRITPYVLPKLADNLLDVREDNTKQAPSFCR